MSDWQVGDLAVCVDARVNPRVGSCPLQVGRVYRVARVVGSGPCALYGRHSLGLILAGVPWSEPEGAAELRFRKIRPDEHKACEPEFVTLLKRSKAPAKETASDWLERVSPLVKKMVEEMREEITTARMEDRASQGPAEANNLRRTY